MAKLTQYRCLSELRLKEAFELKAASVYVRDCVIDADSKATSTLAGPAIFGESGVL